MKKVLLPILVMAFVLMGIAAWAAVGYQNAGSTIGAATDVNCSTGVSCTSDGSTVTQQIDNTASINWNNLSAVYINGKDINWTAGSYLCTETTTGRIYSKSTCP